MTTTDARDEIAKEQFEAIGVDTESAICRLQAIPISLHCWQGDDVGGFENTDQDRLSASSWHTGQRQSKIRVDVRSISSCAPWEWVLSTPKDCDRIL